jgi:hypothetical protein
LVELLVPRFGVGELYLLLPALATLTSGPQARWCAWVSPPLEPFAPALLAHGIALERVLVVRGSGDHLPGTLPSWAFEQALGSGACDAALAWVAEPRVRALRRLQLAAERGRALGVLFRPRKAAREPSPAILRIVLEPIIQGIRVMFLKSRGGARGSIDIGWPADCPVARS